MTIQLYCPMCREPQANVCAELANLGEFECRECGEKFTDEDIKHVMDAGAKWAKVLGWIMNPPADLIEKD